MNHRFFIILSYQGTNYHGWQIQENASTVQGKLQNALSLVLKEDIPVTGAGRTDTGVHASYMVAHFDSSGDFSSIELTEKLNSFLGADISIHKILEVPNDAHARFDAASRTYTYLVNRKKNPYLEHLSSYIYGDINMTAMNEAAAVLPGFNDFTSFSKLHSNNKTNICTIKNAKWVEKGDFMVFTICADRFLRNMVRALTAFMIDAGRGIVAAREISKILEARDRSLFTKTAPAQGLYLSRIEYPQKYKLPDVIQKEFPFL